MLKATRYFEQRVRAARPCLRDEWIEAALAAPIRRVVQPDGRVRLWWRAPDGHYLRVVVLADEETVHNAFFDRDFRPTIAPTEAEPQ